MTTFHRVSSIVVMALARVRWRESSNDTITLQMTSWSH